MSVTLNVRCCCEPLKILGTFEVPSIERYFPYAICEPVSVAATAAAETRLKVEIVDVQIRWFERGVRSGEWAVYSDDRPVEFWRRFCRFKEGAHV